MDLDSEIAVVGVGCRFPGADNLDEFWQVLVKGENHVNEIQKDRWNNDAFFSEDKDEVGKHYVKKAGFLKNYDEWDHRLFGVSENEAMTIDPQQRYVLECTHMAMEDGGITRAEMKGSKTGVYIGVMNDDYKVISNRDHKNATNYSSTGMSTTIIGSRVSYTFDLRGPCMVIDTACSSSMIAIHLGSQAIKTGDCTAAICGGVSSILFPDTFITLCRARMLSAVGQCQTFCDSADGYARSEGCGVVILKTVRKAIEDGNKIWAIIRTGSNQDGHAASPITAPSDEQQEMLLHKVYTQYGVNPTTLQYIETHGTGTPIGDPTETNALGRFISSYRCKETVNLENSQKDKTEERFCQEKVKDKEQDRNKTGSTSAMEYYSNKTKKQSCTRDEQSFTIKIGSVKTNIGHTESAAGVAGLIKVLLMMKHKKLVPSLHLKKDKSNLNKKIKLSEYNLDIALDVEDWEPNDNGERICCVNSFGFGGSNCHAIVLQKKIESKTKIGNIDGSSLGPFKVFCLSAMDKIALHNTMKQFQKDIRRNDISLTDIAHSCAFRRDHFSMRTLIYGHNIEEVSEHINLKSKNIENIKAATKTRLIFVFCGVGTTWTGMCSELMTTQPMFKAKVEEIDTYLQPLSGWRIADKFADSTTDYGDPFLNHIALFCTQVALLAVWEHFGIHPEVIVGQSVGEVAASVASGALSLRDGIKVIYHRSKILAEKTGGKMMVVGNLSIEQIQDVCDTYDNRVTIAVYNSPTSCTLSGDADVMEKIKNDFEGINANENAEILIRPLPVQCAYHSHHVQSCMKDIQTTLSDISKGERRIDHISTVTGEFAKADEFQTGAYWAENIRQAVQFTQSLLKASKENVTNVFVEIGPREVLRAHLSNIMGEDLTGICLPSMSIKQENCIFSSLNDLYEMGVELNWKSLAPLDGIAETIPRYCFNKSKIVYYAESVQQFLKGHKRTANTHLYVHTACDEQTEFRIEIDKEVTPFVYDHYFMDAILVPGATYVEAAFEVGCRKSKFGTHELSVSVEFDNPFTLPADEKQHFIEVKVTEDHAYNGFMYSAVKDGRTLCSGTICGHFESERPPVDISAIRSRCTTYRTMQESYECLEKIDFKYGATLSLMKQSWSSITECFAELRIPDLVRQQTKRTHFHPSVIDAMFQTFGLLNTDGSAGTPTLPKGVESVTITRPLQEHMFCYSQVVKTTSTGKYYNCLLLSPDGHVIAEIQNFYTTYILSSGNKTIKYELVWNEIHRNIDIPSDYTVLENDNSEGFAKLLLFGSKRFHEYYRRVNRKNITYHEINGIVSDAEVVFRTALDQIPDAKAAMFADCHHVQQFKQAEKKPYDIAKSSFLCLAVLIKMLKKRNHTLPLFVITENVISCPKLNIHVSNVFGGELWGLVRSAMSETAYSDIRLVDMILTEENAKALDYLTKLESPNMNEYVINRGSIYSSEMFDIPGKDDVPNQRELKIDAADLLSLNSLHPEKVLKPYFQINRNKNTTFRDSDSSNVRLHLQSISLHDSTTYPTSTESAYSQHAIWPWTKDNGFQVVALEGIGCLIDKPKRNVLSKGEKCKTVGFCYPVNVSTKITVPSKCIFDASSLPFNIPGLMTICNVLWNIAESCEQLTNAYVIVGKLPCVESDLFQNLMTKYKRAHVHTDSVENINKLKSEIGSSVETLVILTKVTETHLDLVHTICPNYERLVSTDGYISRSVQRWALHDKQITGQYILNTEKMFTQSKLSENIPKIRNWLKSLENPILEMLKHYANSNGKNDNITDLFVLPYPTLVVNTNQHCIEDIPLKVFRSELFRTTGCYILVGGLTGLGWELLQIMAELGAGYLVTFSRRLPSQEKQKEIERISRIFRCKILSLQVDITDLNHLEKTVHELRSQIGEAKIKGVFQGGGVVCDKLLSNMTEEDVDKTMQPKILGTWNLHLVTKEMPLDFFFMHSSIVSILGNTGQCNYAAGNAFLDSFASFRRSLGLCGQSINWSTMSLGMATKNEQLEENLRSQGFIYLSLEEVRSCFIHAIMANPAQITYGIFDWSRLEYHPTVKMYPFKFIRLLEKYGSKNQGFQNRDSKYQFDTEEFLTLDLEGQRQMIIGLLKTIVMDIFVVGKDSIHENSRFVEFGIDSLASMSLANSIFEVTRVRMPVLTLLDNAATIGSLATYLLEKMNTISVQKPVVKASEVSTLTEFLEGSVTFMQRSLLKDFVKAPHSRNFMRQADYEIRGIKLTLKDWKVILNHLLKISPDLRRIYALNEEDYKSYLLSPETVDIDLQVVPFDSICGENVIDERGSTFFDLTKDLPIRFKIACKKDKTRMRVYIHSVISDLSGISLLFREIGACMRAHVLKLPFPVRDTDIIPAHSVKVALSPRMNDMKEYWSHQLSQDIQPFTFSENIDSELDEEFWVQERKDLPPELIQSIMQYIQSGVNSLYSFMMSVYMAFLHAQLGIEFIPVVTNVDMRGHVPQLKSFVTRCINEIPVIGDLRNMGTINEYLNKSSVYLHNMTQQSGFPYELIEREMQSEKLRIHIGRHRFVMENMDSLNKTIKHHRVTVKVGNIFHKRHNYETSLYVLYDMSENKIALEYGYNAVAVPHEYAVKVPLKLIQSIKAFLEYKTERVSSVLAKIGVNKYETRSSIIISTGFQTTSQQQEISDMSIKPCLPKEKGQTENHPQANNNSRRTELAGLTTIDALTEENFIPLKEDCFQKQTSQGWDHEVRVQMMKEESRGLLLLMWGNAKERHRRYINLEGVTEVHVKKINSIYGLLLKTSSRWIVLKTRSLVQATGWLNAIRLEMQNKRNGWNDNKYDSRNIDSKT